MDDDEILHSYIPAAWWEQQLAKHPMKRQMLYWQLTQPQHEDITKRLIHALKILESVLAMDPLGDLKRADFAGKFVDDDHQDDMAAELTELVFLSERSKDVVYAPKYPETGPDFRCDLVSRPIEVEVTKLSGTEGEMKSEGLRTQPDTQLYDVPSGCLISIGMLAIRTPEDLTSQISQMQLITKWICHEARRTRVSQARSSLVLAINCQGMLSVRICLWGRHWRGDVWFVFLLNFEGLLVRTGVKCG